MKKLINILILCYLLLLNKATIAMSPNNYAINTIKDINIENGRQTDIFLINFSNNMNIGQNIWKSEIKEFIYPYATTIYLYFDERTNESNINIPIN
jgi:hypothetical protein